MGASDGATIIVDGQSYTTGPLEGRITILAAAASPSLEVDFYLASPVDLGGRGDFGQVRVATSNLAPASESLPSTQEKLVVSLSLELERFSGEKSALSTDSVSFVADEIQTVVHRRSLAAFPPLNQQYSLQEPESLYDSSGKEAGILEGFPVLVNQSA